MTKRRIILTSLLALALGACGGGGDEGSILLPGSGGPGGPDAPVTLDMGHGPLDGFQSGQLGVTVSGLLSAGGITGLSVAVIETTDEPGAAIFYSGDAQIIFSSSCIAEGSAQVTPNPVSTSTGLASVTYTAMGCVGTDVITATATVEGQQLSAVGSVTVVSDAEGLIEFVSATPEKIGLKGTGGVGLPETSTVVFRVLDGTGVPVANQEVGFALNPQMGGIEHAPVSVTSNNEGYVQTVVQSGTVATPVRVTATIVDTQISTQSSPIMISTGLPDQNSFAMTAACQNIEAWDHDDVTSEVTVRLTDRLDNPVPDDTTVTFSAEGGTIDGSCTTTTTGAESGVCTVNWTSGDPRPADGRVSLLATAIGEESFTDLNGNGIFDESDTFDDIGEPFRDDNENGTYDVGEFFFDHNSNGIYDGPDGLFSGLLCEHNTLCGAGTAPVYAQTVIIMSGSHASFSHAITDVPDVHGQFRVTISVGDERGQPMPAGTMIEASVINGSLVGESIVTVPCTEQNEPLEASFLVEGDGTSSTPMMFVTVETPGGTITEYNLVINN